jgi:hypothetical protein
LEHAEYGQVPGAEPSGHSPDLETAQSQATPDRRSSSAATSTSWRSSPTWSGSI